MSNPAHWESRCWCGRSSRLLIGQVAAMPGACAFAARPDHLAIGCGIDAFRRVWTCVTRRVLDDVAQADCSVAPRYPTRPLAFQVDMLMSQVGRILAESAACWPRGDR